MEKTDAKDVRIIVSVTREQREEWKDAAWARKQTLSDFIRDAVARAMS